MKNTKNRAIFLDRDGTINVDYGYVHQIEKFKFIEGAVEGLKLLQEEGYFLIVITNQSGIARGYYSVEEFKNISNYMQQMLKKQGIIIKKTYYCPHLSDCKCRKPGLKLFYDAIAEFNIDLDHSFAIGDKIRDLSICNETNVRGFLLSENDKEETEKGKSLDHIKVVKNLYEAAKIIVQSEK